MNQQDCQHPFVKEYTTIGCPYTACTMCGKEMPLPEPTPKPREVGPIKRFFRWLGE